MENVKSPCVESTRYIYPRKDQILKYTRNIGSRDLDEYMRCRVTFYLCGPFVFEAKPGKSYGWTIYSTVTSKC